MRRRVVVNATSIGSRVNGIGVYGSNLLYALAALETDLEFVVVANETARPRLEGLAGANVRLRWVSGIVSPDRGSRGHWARCALAQVLSLRDASHLVFALSPLEATLWGGPRIVTVHDLIPLRFPQHHPRQRHYYRRFLPRALRATRAIVTPSETTRSLLLTHYGLAPEKVRAIPHGPTVPLEGAAHEEHAGAFVLWLGRSDPVKNLEAALAAYARLRGRVAAEFVVAGSGVDRCAALTYRRALVGREDGTHVRPDVTEGEKIQLLDQAAVLVCPSLDEGFGLTPLEAMARGCPVVATRAGSLPEVCGDAALYVEPGDVDGLASALRRVLEDRALRASLAARGLERVRRLSWERSARCHLELFEEVLAAVAGAATG